MSERSLYSMTMTMSDMSRRYKSGIVSNQERAERFSD